MFALQACGDLRVCKGTLNLKTDWLRLFLFIYFNPHPILLNLSLSVESFHICFFLFVSSCRFGEFMHTSISFYISQVPRYGHIQDLLDRDTYSLDSACLNVLH